MEMLEISGRKREGRGRQEGGREGGKDGRRNDGGKEDFQTMARARVRTEAQRLGSCKLGSHQNTQRTLPSTEMWRATE